MLLGEKIKELREKQGLVQREIAAALEVDTAFISKVEHGERKLNRKQLNKISEKLKISEESLLILWLGDKSLDAIIEEPLGVKALETAINYLNKKKQVI